MCAIARVRGVAGCFFRGRLRGGVSQSLAMRHCRRGCLAHQGRGAGVGRLPLGARLQADALELFREGPRDLLLRGPRVGGSSMRSDLRCRQD